MSAPAIEMCVSTTPELFIHIGAGEGELAGLARRSVRAVMVEPDPERYAELSALLRDAPRVQVIQAALAQAEGTATFLRASLARFGSTRPTTGAKTLYRGLRPAGEASVRAATLSDLVDQRPDQGAVVVIDAASEALRALEQLEALGLLSADHAIFVKVAEIALHEGGAERTGVEAWATERGFALVRLDGEADPDIWMGRLEPGPALVGASSEESGEGAGEDQQAGPDRAELEARIEALEDKARSQAQLVRKHRDKANRTAKQLDKAKNELKAEISARKAAEKSARELSEKTDGLRGELSDLRSSHQTLTERLAAAEKTVKAERDRADKETSARRDAQSALDKAKKALSARADELQAARSEIDALKAELHDAQSAQADLEQAQARAKSLADEVDALTRRVQHAEHKADDARSSLEAERASRSAAEKRAREAEQALSGRDGELEKAQSRIDALETQLSQATASQHALEEARSRAASLQDEIESLKQRFQSAERKAAEARNTLESERASRSSLESRAREAEKAREATNAELESARSDLALALRTQNMSQADLQDLQARHEKLQEDHKGLEELLGKLMDRLYDASDRAKALSWADSVGDEERGSSSRSEG
mgnify:CR=1 FL=1